MLYGREAAGGELSIAMAGLAVALAGVLEMVMRDSTAAYTVRWVATAIAAAFPVPVCIMVADYTLMLAGPGGVAVGMRVPVLAWLLAPQLESLGAERRWRSAGLIAVASIALVAAGALTIRRDDTRPSRENLAYVTSVYSDSAWIVAPSAGISEGSFSVATLGASARRLSA